MIDRPQLREWTAETRELIGLEQFAVALTNGASRPRLTLNALVVPEAYRRQGCASAALRRLCRFADEHRLGVLTSADLGDGAVPRERLEVWIRAYSFEPVGGRVLLRAPK